MMTDNVHMGIKPIEWFTKREDIWILYGEGISGVYELELYPSEKQGLYYAFIYFYPKVNAIGGVYNKTAIYNYLVKDYVEVPVIPILLMNCKDDTLEQIKLYCDKMNMNELQTAIQNFLIFEKN